jgi:hypothetical protein
MTETPDLREDDREPDPGLSGSEGYDEDDDAKEEE